MPRIRTLAMVTVVAIGGILLSSSIPGCNDRSATACQRALSPSGPAPGAFDQSSSKPPGDPRAYKERHLEASPNVTAASGLMQADGDNGVFAQQFQRFVSKQSIRTTTAAQLRSPWPDAASFALTSLHPVSGGVIAASNDATTNNLKPPAANEVAVSDHNDLGDDNHRAMSERRTAVLQSRTSDNGPASVSWVGLAFLVWGGLLTVGSGLRLIFG